jgi:small nuclear ribonucleoprotein B and B'
VLGLIILRGEEIVSLVLEGPPPSEEQQPLHAKNAAPGVGLAKAVGRGMAMPMGAAAAGLAGPARGVGGPAPGMMLPKPQVCYHSNPHCSALVLEATSATSTIFS